jgi:hypothetical protein
MFESFTSRMMQVFCLGKKVLLLFAILGALNQEFQQKKNESPVVGDFAEIMVNKVMSAAVLIITNCLLIYQSSLTLLTSLR